MAEKKKYEVVGPRAYRGHAPGSVFEDTLSEREEARALAAGVLAIKPANTNVREGEEEPTTAAQAAERGEAEREQIAAAEAEQAAAEKARST